MARTKSVKKSTKPVKATKATVSEVKSTSYLERLENEVQSNQSRLSLVLGALIVLVIGVLLFNYFNKPKSEVGPSNQDQNEEQSADVSPENLPGKYTIKEGDTLFLLAEKYYNDGYQYTEIAKANNLENVDSLVVGQVLEIPKLETASPSPEAAASVSPSPTPTESASPTPDTTQNMVSPDEKGAQIQTENWGAPITGTTYTVQAGDWLSTIAGRAYGDIFAFEKIAQANNIQNPDLIEPGTVLNLPR